MRQQNKLVLTQSLQFKINDLLDKIDENLRNEVEEIIDEVFSDGVDQAVTTLHNAISEQISSCVDDIVDKTNITS